MDGDYIGTKDVARMFPHAGRSGASIHPSAVVRWILVGIRLPDGSPLRLRAIRLGGKWATTGEWVREFIAAHTEAYLPWNVGPTPRSFGVRRAAADLAEAELIAAGA